MMCSAWDQICVISIIMLLEVGKRLFEFKNLILVFYLFSIILALPMNHYQVKKLIKDGNVQNLEDKLLNGEGYKLIGHYSMNSKIKTFLQSVPIYMVNIYL